MVLGKLTVPGVGGPTNLDKSRTRAYCVYSRCGWGLFGHFFSHLSFLSSSPSRWKTVRYRLKYCLKGPLSVKQPTNQPIIFHPALRCFKNYGIKANIKQCWSLDGRTASRTRLWIRSAEVRGGTSLGEHNNKCWSPTRPVTGTG